MSELDPKLAKALKDLPEFTDACQNYSADELKQLVLRSEQHIVDTEKAIQEDQKLNATKELLKELRAPYKDTLKVLAVKIKYAMHLLEERGAKPE